MLVWNPTNGWDCWQCMKSQFNRSHTCMKRHIQRAHGCWDYSWLSEDNVITEIGELPQNVYPCGFFSSFLPHLKAQLGCLETKLVRVCEYVVCVCCDGLVARPWCHWPRDYWDRHESRETSSYPYQTRWKIISNNLVSFCIIISPAVPFLNSLITVNFTLAARFCVPPDQSKL